MSRRKQSQRLEARQGQHRASLEASKPFQARATNVEERGLFERQVHSNATISVLRPDSIALYQQQMPVFPMHKDTSECYRDALQASSSREISSSALGPAWVRVNALAPSELAIPPLSSHAVDTRNLLIWHGGPCILDMCWHPLLSIGPSDTARCSVTAALLTCGSMAASDNRDAKARWPAHAGWIHVWLIPFVLSAEDQGSTLPLVSLDRAASVYRVGLAGVPSTAIMSMRWLPFCLASAGSPQGGRQTLLAILSSDSEQVTEILICSFTAIESVFRSASDDWVEWTPASRIRLEKHAFTCIEWSQHASSGLKLLAGTREGMIAVYDLSFATPSLLILLPAHATPIRSLEWHRSNPRLFLSASWDGCVYMWNFDELYSSKRALVTTNAPIYSVAWLSRMPGHLGHDWISETMLCSDERANVKLVNMDDPTGKSTHLATPSPVLLSVYSSPPASAPGLGATLVAMSNWEGLTLIYTLCESTKTTKPTALPLFDWRMREQATTLHAVAQYECGLMQPGSPISAATSLASSAACFSLPPLLRPFEAASASAPTPHFLAAYPKTLWRYQNAMSNVAVAWHPMPIPVLAVAAASGLAHLHFYHPSPR